MHRIIVISITLNLQNDFCILLSHTYGQLPHNQQIHVGNFSLLNESCPYVSVHCTEVAQL